MERGREGERGRGKRGEQRQTGTTTTTHQRSYPFKGTVSKEPVDDEDNMRVHKCDAVEKEVHQHERKVDAMHCSETKTTHKKQQ